MVASFAFTTIDIPGATWTYANGITDTGQIVGGFSDGEYKGHGYLRSVSGVFTTIDAPGATTTSATGINAGGQIVGTFDVGDKHDICISLRMAVLIGRLLSAS